MFLRTLALVYAECSLYFSVIGNVFKGIFIQVDVFQLQVAEVLSSQLPFVDAVCMSEPRISTNVAIIC
jgi:hypothetical protein